VIHFLRLHQQHWAWQGKTCTENAEMLFGSGMYGHRCRDTHEIFHFRSFDNEVITNVTACLKPLPNIVGVRRIWLPTATQDRGIIRTEMFGSRPGVANGKSEEVKGDKHIQAAVLSTRRPGRPAPTIAYPSPLF
jgi:hypothetical protein